MRLINVEKNGHSFCCVDTWHTEGIEHGFGDRSLDAKQGSLVWQEVNSGKAPELLLLNQIHSDKIVEIKPADAMAHRNSQSEGDAWLCLGRDAENQGIALGIRTADCVPLLILDKSRELCAALHCGWRGIVAGIIPKAIERITDAGFAAASLEIAVGPSALSCCYEIGAEVADEFKAAALHCDSAAKVSSVVIERGAKKFGHLHNLIALQLQSLNLAGKQIVFSNSCTICNEKFFSFRRDPQSSGRQLSYICC